MHQSVQVGMLGCTLSPTHARLFTGTGVMTSRVGWHPRGFQRRAGMAWLMVLLHPSSGNRMVVVVAGSGTGVLGRPVQVRPLLLRVRPLMRREPDMPPLHESRSTGGGRPL